MVFKSQVLVDYVLHTDTLITQLISQIPVFVSAIYPEQLVGSLTI